VSNGRHATPLTTVVRVLVTVNRQATTCEQRTGGEISRSRSECCTCVHKPLSTGARAHGRSWRNASHAWRVSVRLDDLQTSTSLVRQTRAAISRRNRPCCETETGRSPIVDVLNSMGGFVNRRCYDSTTLTNHKRMSVQRICFIDGKMNAQQMLLTDII